MYKTTPRPYSLQRRTIEIMNDKYRRPRLVAGPWERISIWPNLDMAVAKAMELIKNRRGVFYQYRVNVINRRVWPTTKRWSNRALKKEKLK